jgi:hypothetical protein
LNRGCFEAVLMKNTLRTLGVNNKKWHLAFYRIYSHATSKLFYTLKG